MNHSSRMGIREADPNLHPETQKIKRLWNHHSSYQWVYFDENYKKIISEYLSDRLAGPNLEIGGGWYLSHHDSTVIDVSENALEYNPAKNKDCFDLDDLGRGKDLPYRDSVFESATMISVWQYLGYPQRLLEEIRRVLVPGGELYIINEQGAGLDEVKKQPSHSYGILNQIRELGYEARLEDIGIIGGNDGFKSVIVTMPQPLLLDTVRMVKDSADVALSASGDDLRYERNLLFKKELVRKEMKRADYLFHMIEEYPVTRFSLDYIGRLEELSREIKEKTGEDMLCMLEMSCEPEIYMSTDDKNLFPHFYMKSRDNKDMEELFSKIGLRGCRCYSSLEKDILEELGSDPCKTGPADGNIPDMMISFLCNIALNDYSRDIQKRLHEHFKERSPKKLDEMIFRRKTSILFNLFEDHKQRKKLDWLIEQKKAIEKCGIATAGTMKLDYLKHLRHFKPMLESRYSFRSRSYPVD